MKTTRIQGLRQRPRFVAALLVAGALCSCSKPHPLQIVVPGDTKVEKGQPVFVDAIKAGEVLNVTTEAGRPVANLSITEKPAKERLKQGIVWTAKDGEILINTGNVLEGAHDFPRGGVVPMASALDNLIMTQGANITKTAVVVVGGLILTVVLWLVFRSVVGTIGIVLSAALAGILTQVFFLHAVPIVKQGLARLGDPPAMEQPAATTPAKETESVQNNLVPSPDEVIRKGEEKIREIASHRPSPEVLTWCLMFILTFVLLNIVLGKATRTWRK